MRRAVWVGVIAVVVGTAVPATAGAAESDCFWLGPVSFKKRATNPERFDGHFFNFPEESATYWLARFRLAPGQGLELHGRYPHARYESLNSYEQGGTPVSALADVRLRADRGSANPFRAGARRDRRRRDWTVAVLDAAPPAGAGAANTLYAPSTATFASEIVLRVYEPDRGRDLTGGVGLPEPQLVDAD